MTNEEKAVIQAARDAVTKYMPDALSGTFLAAAVERLKNAPRPQRKFWVNFSLISAAGSGEGSIDAYLPAGVPVTLDVINAWRAGISQNNRGASIVIRTWTELEA